MLLHTIICTYSFSNTEYGFHKKSIRSLYFDIMFLFVYLRVFIPLENFFTHMETSAIPMKGLQILTYARHSWPYHNEGTLACHTCCDIGPPFIIVISEDPSSPKTHKMHTYCRAFSSGAVATCFYDLCLSRLGFEHPTFRMRNELSNRQRRRRG